MNHSLSYRPSLLAALATLGLGSTALAQTPITISNFGFESPVLAELVYPSTITGWTQGKYDVLAPTVWIVGSSGAGHYNLSTSEYTTPTAPEGSNMAYTTTAAGFDTGIAQVLTTNLQANAQYEMSVKVGNPFVYTAGLTADYRIELLAGGVLLQSATGPSPVDDTTFTTATLSYNSGASPAQLGQALEIRLIAKDFTSALEVDFDDVQLTVALSNPVANAGGPYTVPNSGSLSLNGGASLPSDGQTITTYEWDLDNDGDYGDNPVSGVNPTAITNSDLRTIYGLNYGANTIALRVTDSSSPTPKTATATGTVTLSPPIGCQLGVLNLTANGGINPNTGLAWQVGDKYRIAFHTNGTTTTTSNDPEYYNDFVTTEAWTVAALQGAYWRAMITVNLDPTTTQALSPKREVKANTGTGDLTGGFAQGGAGEPVYVVNGTRCIARNNADIWNTWSNPFENSLGCPQYFRHWQQHDPCLRCFLLALPQSKWCSNGECGCCPWKRHRDRMQRVRKPRERLGQHH